MTARALKIIVSDLREMAADTSGRGNSDLMREAADAIEALTKNQRKGGKARWKRTTKKQRSAAAKAAADARWKTKKATGPQNNGDVGRGP
jgi:hypothetical protein